MKVTLLNDGGYYNIAGTIFPLRGVEAFLSISNPNVVEIPGEAIKAVGGRWVGASIPPRPRALGWTFHIGTEVSIEEE